MKRYYNLNTDEIITRDQFVDLAWKQRNAYKAMIELGLRDPDTLPSLSEIMENTDDVVEILD